MREKWNKRQAIKNGLHSRVKEYSGSYLVMLDRSDAPEYSYSFNHYCFEVWEHCKFGGVHIDGL